MCSGSEAGSYLRLIDLVYHSTLGLRVIKKEECGGVGGIVVEDCLAEVRRVARKVALLYVGVGCIT